MSRPRAYAAVSRSKRAKKEAARSRLDSGLGPSRSARVAPVTLVPAEVGRRLLERRREMVLGS